MQGSFSWVYATILVRSRRPSHLFVNLADASLLPFLFIKESFGFVNEPMCWPTEFGFSFHLQSPDLSASQKHSDITILTHLEDWTIIRGGNRGKCSSTFDSPCRCESFGIDAKNGTKGPESPLAVGYDSPINTT